MQAMDDLQVMGTGSEGSDLLLLAEAKEAHRLGEGDGAVGIKTARQFVGVMIKIGGDGERRRCSPPVSGRCGWGPSLSFAPPAGSPPPVAGSWPPSR